MGRHLGTRTVSAGAWPSGAALNQCHLAAMSSNSWCPMAGSPQGMWLCLLSFTYLFLSSAVMLPSFAVAQGLQMDYRSGFLRAA